MKAHAAIRSYATSRGSRHHLKSVPPLTLRRTPSGVHLVGSAAGPLGGDRLSIDVSVEAGARLELRTVAATIALAGARPGRSSFDARIDVGPAAGLRWIPEPTIFAAGCDHRASISVDLAAGASLVLREVIVLGRWGETSGSGMSRLGITREGAPLVRAETCFGPAHPTSSGPTGLGGARAVGSLLVVGRPPLPRLEEPGWSRGVRAGVFRIAPDAWQVTALDRSPGRVQQLFEWIAGEVPVDVHDRARDGNASAWTSARQTATPANG